MGGGQLNNLDLNEKTNLNNNSTDLFCSPIRFRCPTCSKLYSSDPSKIFVEHPEYTCSSCSTEFSISLLQALQMPEVLGIKTLKSLSPKTISLPSENQEKSEHVVESLQKEQLLERAGAAPLKTSFQDVQESKALQKIELLWSSVLEKYEDRELHVTFIKTCRDEGRLEAAIEKYTNIAKANPNDELTQSFLSKIQVFQESKQLFTAEQKRKFFTKTFYTTLGIVCFGILLIFAGLFWGGDKNLAGLGIGLIFFTFAVKAFFQPRRPNLG